MTQPKRPPVKPGPITDDPTHGQHQVVVTFRIVPYRGTEPRWRELLEARLGALATSLGSHSDLTVHVRRIGAGGERSEQEIWPALTEDLGPVRATENLDTGGKT